MTTYIVTFEVNDSNRKKRVYEKLKSYKIACPILDSVWAIRSENKAPAIRDDLKTILSRDDRVFVIRSGTEAAWVNSYGILNNEWLKKYL